MEKVLQLVFKKADAHDQNGDSQNTAVGGDQGQINAQRVIQCNHVLLED